MNLTKEFFEVKRNEETSGWESDPQQHYFEYYTRKGWIYEECSSQLICVNSYTGQSVNLYEDEYETEFYCEDCGRNFIEGTEQVIRHPDKTTICIKCAEKAIADEGQWFKDYLEEGEIR